MAVLCEAKVSLVLATLLAVLPNPPASAETTKGLRAETTAEGVRILEDDRPVLFYQRQPKSAERRFERAAYVHPLYDLDGHVLTEDFPADHPHHRGIYWAWHQISVAGQPVGDPWVAQDFSWHVEHVGVTARPSQALTLTAQVLWTSPLWVDEQQQHRPLVEETTQITIHPASDDSRRIDFRIELRAQENELRIGGSEDAKGYGGFSVRMRLPPDVRFTGRDGELEPQTNSIAAGPWMDISGTFSTDRTSGLTILCHPSCPGFPQPWILRRSRSMQNPAWPGRQPVLLSTETPTVLQYRLVLHRGEPSPEMIEAWQAEYAGGSDHQK